MGSLRLAEPLATWRHCLAGTNFVHELSGQVFLSTHDAWQGLRGEPALPGPILRYILIPRERGHAWTLRSGLSPPPLC